MPGAPGCFFIKVTNLFSSREIEVTHIWFATEPRVDVLNQERPLPARLRLDETFETWIPVSAVPAVRHVGSKVRVRLSNDKVIKSKLDKRIPAPRLCGRTRERVGKLPLALVAARPARQSASAGSGRAAS